MKKIYQELRSLFIDFHSTPSIFSLYLSLNIDILIDRFVSFYPADPSLDAWKGAQMWSKIAAKNGFSELTTRQVYEEHGFDYLTENAISNRFFASLKALQVNPKFNPGRGRQIAGVLPRAQNQEI